MGPTTVLNPMLGQYKVEFKLRETVDGASISGHNTSMISQMYVSKYGMNARARTCKGKCPHRK